MSLSIYMKPTNYCNIDCEHCYLSPEIRADKSVMSAESIAMTAQFVLDLARREGHESIHFIWHGGEPMVLSPSYYELASSILDDVIGPEYYTQSMQTSLIPYRPEWATVLHKRFGSHVGTSIDFTQRHVKDSREDYISLWLKKVSLARNDGIKMTPGIVPTRHEVPKASQLVDWFSDNDFPFFNVDRFSQFGEQTIDWPSNAQHSRFLIGLFDRMVERKRKGLRVSFINVLITGINGVLYGVPGDRWGTKCQREFIVVEPDGSLNTCPDRAHHEDPFANISDGPKAFQESEGRRKWIRIANVTHKKDHCSVCEYQSWCSSGCPVTPNGPSEGQEECSGYKRFLKHVETSCRDPEVYAIVMDYLSSLPTGLPLSESVLEKTRD